MPVLRFQSRRSFLLGLPACAVATSWSLGAMAGAAVPVSLGRLVGSSTTIVVGAPRAATSRWEERGGTRRIVTASEVEVLQVLAHRAPKDSSLVVQTLGGRVGDIGQVVHGEAQLDLDRPAVLFLREGDAGRLRVTALAQGHYRLEDDESGTPRLLPSPLLGEFLMQDPFGAVARLRGQTLRRCETLILEELGRAH